MSIVWFIGSILWLAIALGCMVVALTFFIQLRYRTPDLTTLSDSDVTHGIVFAASALVAAGLCGITLTMGFMS